jgi:hypothetical protein
VNPAAADAFAEHAAADAASELLRDVLGAGGVHGRLVLGVRALPARMPVELVVEVDDGLPIAFTG